MDKLKVLVLGDGLLGSELVRQTGWNYISRRKDKFTTDNFHNFSHQIKNYDVIVNCIADTNTYSTDKDSHWKTNYVFVNDLIQFCNSHNIKLVQISTDYLYTNSIEFASEADVPVHCNNWYGYTKLLSDGLTQLLSQNYLLIRCSHKPNPFPYEKAWVDLVGNFDYVDIISNKIISLINTNCSGLFNVGTETKTIFDLAGKTKTDVEPTNSPDYVPKNITMNLEKLNVSLSVEKPFFSIAIPAYGYNGKGRDFLENNFKVFQTQSFKDFEVVVSDHSIDDTIKIVCDEWSNRLNIKYLRNENGRGVISPNINNAMKNSSGKWIKILFQDDYLHSSDSLLFIKEFIDNNPDTKWIASTFWHTNDGENLHRRLVPSWPPVPIWTGHNHIGCPSVITIKNEDIIYFDDELNWLMDCDYYHRMFLKYGLPMILDKDTVVNRNVDERLSNTRPQDKRTIEYQKLNNLYNK
jgi:dTDP-4-dehydrorhamnose reductase